MSRPYRPPIVFDSISREANTRFSLDAQSITYKPCRRFRFTIGSVIMPPTLRPSPSSISMTFRRQYVLPAPGRPVMPILSASPMPPTRRHKYALLYKNTLRIRRPRIGAARPAHGLRGSGLSPARGPRDEGTSLSCGGSDLRPDVHATGASVWGRDLPNVSEV